MQKSLLLQFSSSETKAVDLLNVENYVKYHALYYFRCFLINYCCNLKLIACLLSNGHFTFIQVLKPSKDCEIKGVSD